MELTLCVVYQIKQIYTQFKVTINCIYFTNLLTHFFPMTFLGGKKECIGLTEAIEKTYFH